MEVEARPTPLFTFQKVIWPLQGGGMQSLEVAVLQGKEVPDGYKALVSVSLFIWKCLTI